jgi:ABC-type transport system substrate-binding protein
MIKRSPYFSMEVIEMKKILSIKIILLICILGTLLCFIGCTPPVPTGTGTITGVINVYWPEVGYVPGAARIDVLDEGIFTVSSFSNGTYILNNIPTGQHTITVIKHGYKIAQQVVNLLEGQTVTNVNFNLETEIASVQLGGIYYYGFNMDATPFNNLLIRKAMNYAIDKQTLLNEINLEFGSNHVVAEGIIPPTMIGYNSSLASYYYDVNKAQILLAEAGYPDGFKINLYYYTVNNGAHYFIAKKIQTYLSQVGVTVELHGVEWEEFLELINQGELPFFGMSWTADSPDPTDILYFLYHSKSSFNNNHYNNPSIDNQIEQAWETIDEAAFIQLIQQIESTIVGDAPAIYLYHY